MFDISEFISQFRYGSGPRPDHYYAGLTPKDVVLARSATGGVVQRGYGAPRILRDREIHRGRDMQDDLLAFMTEGALPSNFELFHIMDAFQNSMNSHVYSHNLSEDTRQILDSINGFLNVMRNMLQSKNGDEVFQRFIHHLILSRRALADQRRRVSLHRVGRFDKPETEVAPTNVVAQIIRMAFSSSDFQRVLQDARMLASKVIGPRYQRQIPMRRQTPVRTSPRRRHPPKSGPLHSAYDFSQDEAGHEKVVRSPHVEPRPRRPQTKTEDENGYIFDGDTLLGDMGWEPSNSPTQQTRYSRHVSFYSDEGSDQGRQTGRQNATSSVRGEPTSHQYQGSGYAARSSETQGGAYAARSTETQQQQRGRASPVLEQKYMERKVQYQSPHMSLQREVPSRTPKMETRRESFVSQEESPLSMHHEPDETELQMDLMLRLREVLREVASMPKFSEMIGLFLSTITELGTISSSKYDVEGHRRTMALMQDDLNRRALMNEFKTILERFAGGYSLDNIIAIIDRFQAAYADDYVLRSYVVQVTEFVRKSLTDTEFLDNVDFVPAGTELLRDGRFIFGDRYAQLTDPLMQEFFNLMDAIQNDRMTNELADSARMMVRSIFYDRKTGRPALKTAILKDVRNVYLPLFLDTFRYIPLPRIEISDDNYDIAFDNIVFSTENILPNLIELAMQNELQVSPRPDLPDAYFINIITLNIYQIQCDFRNIEFAIRKKSFPKMEDMGLADVFLGGNGLSVETKTAYDSNLWYTTLVPQEINATIDNLRIQLHDSQHDTLYRLLGKSLLNSIKKRLTASIEDAIFNIIRSIDASVTEASRGMKGNMGKQAAVRMMSLW